MPRASSIDRLAPALKARLQKLLDTPGITQQQIADAINEEAGQSVISKSGVNRYSMGMRRFAERNRQARELVTAYLEHVGQEGQEEMSQVMVHQLRTIIYDLMLGIQTLQEGEAEDPELIRRIAEMVSRVSRSLRETEAAADRSVERRRKLREDVAAAAAVEAATAAKEAGMSQETVDAIKARILGVA